MKQNEIGRWRMIFEASFFLITGLAVVAALSLLFIFVRIEVIAPVSPILIVAAFAGIALIVTGLGIVRELLVSNRGEPSFADKLAGDKLSPAGVAGLTVHADRTNSLVRVYPKGDQAQPEAGAAERPDGESATISPAPARS